MVLEKALDVTAFVEAIAFIIRHTRPISPHLESFSDFFTRQDEYFIKFSGKIDDCLRNSDFEQFCTSFKNLQAEARNLLDTLVQTCEVLLNKGNKNAAKEAFNCIKEISSNFSKAEVLSELELRDTLAYAKRIISL